MTLARGKAIFEHRILETCSTYHNGEIVPRTPVRLILYTRRLVIVNCAPCSAIFGSARIDTPRGNPLMVYQCTKPEEDPRDLRSGFLTDMKRHCPRRFLKPCPVRGSNLFKIVRSLNVVYSLRSHPRRDLEHGSL